MTPSNKGFDSGTHTHTHHQPVELHVFFGSFSVTGVSYTSPVTSNFHQLSEADHFSIYYCLSGAKDDTHKSQHRSVPVLPQAFWFGKQVARFSRVMSPRDSTARSCQGPFRCLAAGA